MKTTKNLRETRRKNKILEKKESLRRGSFFRYIREKLRKLRRKRNPEALVWEEVE